MTSIFQNEWSWFSQEFVEITESSWKCEIIVLMILTWILKDVLQNYWSWFSLRDMGNCKGLSRFTNHGAHGSHLHFKKKIFISFDHDAHAAHRHENTEWS